MVGIKGNRRTLYSKKVIIDAFLKLLQEKNLNKLPLPIFAKKQILIVELFIRITMIPLI